MWPSTEAFNRSDIAADWPTAALVPAWAADRGPPRGDPGRRRRRGQALLAALVVVSPGEHPQRVARRPAGHRRPLDPGRGLHRRGHRRRRRPATSWPAAGSRTSGTPTSPRRRSCSSTCPTRSSAATRATTSCSARRATTTTAPFDLLRREIARLEPQKVYLPLGVGGHVDHQLCRDVGVGLLEEAARWVMPGPDYAGHGRLLRGLPVRAGGTTSAASRTSAPDPFAGLAARRLDRSRPTPTSPTSSSARSWASTCTRARSSACSTARKAMADAVRAYGAGDRRARRGRRLGRALLGLRPRLTRERPTAADGPDGPRSRPALDRRSAVASSLGVVIRSLLLPTEGLRGDLDQFVVWVHGIAVNGLARCTAYDQNLVTFGRR